ncbi:Uncharacterised protein [Streptococcus suis]|nr:Uncharacterised protein [Streptococcus suis]
MPLLFINIYKVPNGQIPTHSLHRFQIQTKRNLTRGDGFLDAGTTEEVLASQLFWNHWDSFWNLTRPSSLLTTHFLTHLIHQLYIVFHTKGKCQLEAINLLTFIEGPSLNILYIRKTSSPDHTTDFCLIMLLQGQLVLEVRVEGRTKVSLTTSRHHKVKTNGLTLTRNTGQEFE